MDERLRIREARLRRIAMQRGLTLKKSIRLRSTATDPGTYDLVDVTTHALVARMSLEDVERYLIDRAAERPQTGP